NQKLSSFLPEIILSATLWHPVTTAPCQYFVLCSDLSVKPTTPDPAGLIGNCKGAPEPNERGRKQFIKWHTKKCDRA
ncbi:MAG: hypothetical protein RBR21_11775, partial [Bacteroidales bacterium]|nr:hypothetical protein [Bacteroidales bacterium]